ncbi:chalcone isomerase family protein [Bowmanella dokdonensis]|uniref:Chalcone isomerase family protein n=1 Tax=Bowmanella dokdonensis TaxID=751969 RepID=A0A939DQS8_9ALTE|nr:chalcone isomerase family protein [Bowmanella dokdonensis]MBN7827107.1 chalcone isomerase family protein [Bowmanella dokdonensis]
MKLLIFPFLALGLALFSIKPLASPLADLKLVGQAKLSVWFWDIYQSSLYSPDGKYRQGHYPLALQIRYLRDIKASELIEATEEQWQALALKDKAIPSWLKQLESIWPDIQKGDELTLEVTQNRISRFYHNGEPIGTFEDPDFGPAFLAIWLAENASYPKLRGQLTGRTQP